jgi:RecB family exonuclease
VLPDAERDRVDGALERRADRRVRDRAAYLAALSSAPLQILTFPRADLRAQRAARPAAWLLETAKARAGRFVAAEELEPGRAAGANGETAAWLRIVSSFDGAVRAAREPVSLQEHDLQSLLRWRGSRARHPLVRAEPALRAGLRATRARAGRRLDAWDGIIDPALIAPPSGETALSPTSLEHWAKCPFRYLLGQILHVQAVDRPEDRDRISPRDRGSLIHAVLEQFLATHPRTAPEHGWSADERAELRAAAERWCDEFEGLGLTGRRVLWRLDRARILRELDRVLDTDEAVRAERGLVPHEFELGFGGANDDLPAVRFDLPTGVTVAFRGRIDRVDVDRDGGFEVFDYKTGRPDVDEATLCDDPVVGGTRLQLAIYSLALRQGTGRSVRGSYWFTRNTEADALCGFPLDTSTEARVRSVLDLVAEEITAGHFPAYPGPDDYWHGPLSCRTCDYDRLCPRDRVRRFERRRSDPVLEGILSLREPDEDDVDTEEVDA